MTVSEFVGLAAVYGIIGSLAVFGVLVIVWLAGHVLINSIAGYFGGPYVLVKYAFQLFKR